MNFKKTEIDNVISCELDNGRTQKVKYEKANGYIKFSTLVCDIKSSDTKKAHLTCQTLNHKSDLVNFFVNANHGIECEAFLFSSLENKELLKIKQNIILTNIAVMADKIEYLMSRTGEDKN